MLDKICFESPKFEDTREKKTLHGLIWLGLTDDEIHTITIQIIENESVINNIEATGYVMNQFHLFLQKSKHYNNFEHNLKFIGHNDAHSIIEDIRETRPLRFYAEDEKLFYILSLTESFQIRNKKVSFHPPNNIALCLSISKKCYKAAVGILDPILIEKNKEKIEIKGLDAKNLYDYFENIQSSIIFAYTAVEAFANASIPDAFILERINDKGIKELWTKDNVERWMSTTEKITEVLPSILKTENIKENSFWADFKDLEKSRNNLIHQKVSNNSNKLDSHFLNSLISPNTFRLISSAIKVIDYFYKYDNKHPYFPLGLGIAEYQTIVVESMEKHFRAVGDTTVEKDVDK